MNRRMKAVIRFTVSDQSLVPFFVLVFQFLDDTFIARASEEKCTLGVFCSLFGLICPPSANATNDPVSLKAIPTSS